MSVVLTNPDGQSAALLGQFTYQGSGTPTPDGGPPATDSGSGGCNAGSSFPSLLGFAALLLWLRRKGRARGQTKSAAGGGPT